ncbi:EpsG family protein [Selenomonas ruminantium]|uniref:EpsG family protein n=1 Tax=Selenomonas ruminantium TaxID=971 RepID=A0A1H0UEX8_SELRU|nr:EpsG family protein [Selenomonas ruminantium]SDP64734.1 EpsG family protein [Selenomonas ruminantium]
MLTLFFYTLIDFIAILLVAISDSANKVIKLSFIGNRYIHLSEFLYFISAVLLFMIVALRDNVGADFSIYANAYLNIIHDDLNETEKNWLGIGYVILCNVIGVFAGNSYHWMFAVVAAITIASFYIAFYLANKQRTWSVTLFIGFCLYYQCFNQARQMLAVAICSLAYIALMKKRTSVFIIVVVIAMLFHSSAIVMMLLLIANKIKFNVSKIFVFLFISIASMIVFDIFVDLMSKSFYGMIYIGSEMYDVSFKTSVIINTVFRALLLMFCMFFYNKLIHNNEENRILINTGFICLFFQILTLKSYLFGRITTYFFITYLFIMPRIFELICKHTVIRDRVVVKFLFGVSIMIYHYTYYFMVAKDSGYDKYDTFLF